MDGNIDKFRQLLEKEHLDPNARDSHGDTPGHQVATDNQVSFLSLLLDHGFDVDTINNDGDTALHLAVRNGNDEAIRCLMRRLPDLTIMNRRWQTAMEELESLYDRKFIQASAEFSTHKRKVLKDHCATQVYLLVQRARQKEVLLGRDIDLSVSESDFHPTRCEPLDHVEKVKIIAAVKANATILRTVEAGIHTAASDVALKGSFSGVVGKK